MQNIKHNTVRIAVLGGGSWGSALAHMLAGAGHEVCLFVRNEATALHINTAHKNPHYLHKYVLHENVTASTDLTQLRGQDLYVLAIPTQNLRVFLQEIGEFLPFGAVLVNTAKGIEHQSSCTMNSVVQQVLAHKAPQYAILSGPSFATEVMENLPTAVVLGCETHGLDVRLRSIFSSPIFRCYSCSDVLGVELGGALKNIMAIAVGLCDGLGFGHNTRAALMTRSLAEMCRIGVALGAQERTFMGLSGLGDLTLTCMGDASRNRQVGLRLGKGECLENIEKSLGMVAEGVKTTAAAKIILEKYDISAPIINAVYAIVHEGASAYDCVNTLMTRSLKAE